jgi:hypothetical protein
MDEFFDVPNLEPSFKMNMETIKMVVLSKVIPLVPKSIPMGITLNDFIAQVIIATTNVTIRSLVSVEGKALLGSMHLLSAEEKTLPAVVDVFPGLSGDALFKVKASDPPPPPKGVEGEWIPKL